MSAVLSKTITEADIVLFAGVSGDNNALHTDDEFAASSPFGGRVAHGMLTASLISAALANRLPGPGTAIYISQQLNFRAPVRPGDTVHASVTVQHIDTARHRVTMTTVCHVRNEVVLDGEALLKVASGSERHRGNAGTGAGGQPDTGARPQHQTRGKS